MVEKIVKAKITSDNFLRLKFLSLVFIGFSLFALTMHFSKVEYWVGQKDVYVVLDYIFAAITLVSFLFFWIYKTDNIKLKNWFVALITFLVLIWSAIITGVELTSLGFSTYMIAIVATAFYIYLNLLVSILLYSVSFIAFIITLYLFNQLNEASYPFLISFFPVLMVSYLISRKNFINKVKTLKQSEELKVLTKKLQYAKNNLEEEVKVRTAELREAKERAEQANRLKTEFLHNMSHEVRTPLNGIMGFSEIIEMPGLSEEKRKKYLRIIRSSSQQLLRIIDDILEISNLETKQLELREGNFCLNDLLIEMHSGAKAKAKEQGISLHLKMELSKDQSFIQSDKYKLTKILSNLLENALRFTQEGYVEIGYYLKKTNLVLYVKDTGIGISPESQEIIFERFSQEDKNLSRKYGGLGLGLSISKENAELLGGTITVESEKGKGATFFITIPYKPVLNSSADENRSLANLPEEKTPVILIVEDEITNYLYLEALFEEEPHVSYKLLHAKNGQEAIDICTETPDVDLVLMDIKMPGMDGYEATKRIKAERPGIPIIAQTAYSDNENREKALKAGCDDTLTKPIDMTGFFELITKYIAKD